MSEKRPFFSIIIPTYNRPQQLARCLMSIAKLDYPREQFEVVVVNDGGEHLDSNQIDQFSSLINFHLLLQPNQGPATARNTGASAANGTILAFTDDDCEPAPDWLTILEKGLGEETAVAVGGKTINAYPENVFSTASQLLIDYLYDYYNLPTGTFFTSNNFAVPKKLFLEAGGFDTTMPLAAGEDREFCDRWRYLGYTLRFVPDAVVQHRHWLTARKYWRQHFSYGKGAFQFHQIRAERKQAPVKVEPASFYIKLMSYPFSRQKSWLSFLYAKLFGVAQFANALGFFWARGRNGR